VTNISFIASQPVTGDLLVTVNWVNYIFSGN